MNDGVHDYPVSAGREASTPARRSSAAKVAAHSRWAHESDRRAAMAPARDGFEKRFLDEVDPGRVLEPGERIRRAESAKRAYFTRLAMKSAAARAAKKSA